MTSGNEATAVAECLGVVAESGVRRFPNCLSLILYLHLVRVSCHDVAIRVFDYSASECVCKAPLQVLVGLMFAATLVK